MASMLSASSTSAKDGTMSEPLDNPVWHSLIGAHAHFASGEGLARHYPRDVAPFSGIESASAAAYADLAAHLPPTAEARLFRPTDEPLPEGWIKVDAFPMLQMVARNAPIAASGAPSPAILNSEDIGAMMELVAIAKPGPFGARTPQLGAYLGIREGGHIIALAGERMRVPGYVELSGICTHPSARGRGLAARLTGRLMQAALARGDVPFLHVRAENRAAVSLYRRLGFEVRREIWVLWHKPAGKAA